MLHAFLAHAQVPRELSPVPRFHRPPKLLAHEDTTLWWVQVVTGFVLFFLATVHLYQMLMHPGDIGPYESADRVWSGRWWPLYLVMLFCVELHGGIGLYRLAVKWGWFEGKDAEREPQAAQAAEVGADRLLPRARPRHARGVHEDRLRASRRGWARYTPAWLQARRSAAPFWWPSWLRSAQMNVVYTDVLVIGGGLAGLRMAIGAKRRGHDASSFRSFRRSARTPRRPRAACRRASAT